MSVTIEISPLDILFFKNAKPFNAGDDSWTDGMPFPTPSTIYGALRAIYFQNNPKEINKANSEDDPTKNLVIHKIYLKKDKNIYFPLPLDIVYKKEIRTYTYILHPKEKESDIVSNYKTEFLLNLSNTSNTIESFENSFFTISNFKKYQDYKNETFRSFKEIKSIQELIFNEPKVGIKINKNSHTVEEGYLYRIDFKRLANTKIVVEFSGLEDIKNSKIIKLGGEGKFAAIEKIEKVEIDFPENISKKFKLYFLTPAIFDKGWLPSWIKEDNFIGEYKGIKLKLLAASIGKYKLIGGFDMKKNRPKPMYKAVPEGSIYYFELLEGDQETIREIFHNKSISDKLRNEGYGITFVGAVK